MRVAAFLVFLTLLCTSVAYAQKTAEAPDTSVRRFEIGGQILDLRPEPCSGLLSCAPAPRINLAPALTLNLSQRFAIDATYATSLASDNNSVSFYDGAFKGGRSTQLLVGPRAEARAQHYGFFADASAGYVSWSRIHTSTNVVTTNGTQTFVPIYGRRTFLATQFGGGIEYTPSDRIHVRAGLGDLVTRYCGECVTVRYCNVGPCATRWINNVQTTLGVYVSTGKVLEPAPRFLPPSHRFFDKTNLSLIGISLLAQTADAVTTQRFLRRGAQEGDPLARPFVNQGWGGQIALMAIVNTAEIYVMYGFHRMRHHRIERTLPVAIAAASAVAASLNAGVDYSKINPPVP